MEKGEKDRGECFLKKDIDSVLLDLYKPKKHIIEKQKFKNFNNYKINYFGAPEKYIENYNNCGNNKSLTKEEMKLRVIRYTHLSQLYSIFKANLIKEEYSLENNILYDCVIKLRFDCFPLKPLVCKNYNMNFIYYEDIGQPDNVISDWFNMGSNEIMNIYSSMFLNFKYLNNTKGFYKKGERENFSLWDTNEYNLGVEVFIRDLMKKYNIPKKSLKLRFKLSSGV